MQAKSFAILLLANGALSAKQLQQAAFCLSKYTPVDFAFSLGPDGPVSPVVATLLSTLQLEGLCCAVRRGEGWPQLYLIEPKGEYEADLIRAQLPWNLTEYCFKLVRWIRVTGAKDVTRSIEKMVQQQGLLYQSDKVWGTEQ